MGPWSPGAGGAPARASHRGLATHGWGWPQPGELRGQPRGPRPPAGARARRAGARARARRARLGIAESRTDLRRTSMPTLDDRMIAPAPPEEVWKILYDPSRFPEWWDGLESVDTDAEKGDFTRFSDGYPDYPMPQELETNRSDG